MRRAFTMIELVFVIVVIGILAMIAVPKFAATRDDAIVTKAKTAVASIRSALSTEVQKRILAGNYTTVSNIGGVANGHDKPIFDYFDGNKTSGRVLEYAPHSCKGANSKGCWMRTGASTYKYYFSGSSKSVDFKVSNNRFDCVDPTSTQCAALER